MTKIKQSVKRRILYTLGFELISVTGTTIFFVILGYDVLHAMPFSVLISVIAVVWNFIWNTIFETIEKRINWKGRSVGNRIVHAIGFEGGLLIMLIPLMAWWLGISLLEAFIMELGLLAFFLLFTYTYNYAFDRIFGLPESAK